MFHIEYIKASPKPSWQEITRFLHISPNFLPNFVHECRQNQLWLSLYAFFVQQLPRCLQLSDETLIIRDVMPLFDVFLEKWHDFLIKFYIFVIIFEKCQQANARTDNFAFHRSDSGTFATPSGLRSSGREFDGDCEGNMRKTATVGCWE